jgi:hypothetical protein
MSLEVKAGAVSAASAASSWLVADQWSTHILGVPVSVVLAAFAGAVLVLSFLPPASKGRVPWQVKIVSATLFASILEPLIAHFFSIPDKAQLGLAAAIAAALQALAVPEVREWMRDQINRRFGGGQ